MTEVNAETPTNIDFLSVFLTGSAFERCTAPLWARKWKTRIVVAAVTTTVVVTALAAAHAFLGRSDRARDKPRVALIYVGADDCAPCQTWHRRHEPDFRSSVQFNRLEYQEVRSPTLFDVLKDDYWPTPIRGYRALLGHSAGVPFWFVVVDGRVVVTAGGIGQWDAKILPTIKSLLR